MPDRGWDCFRNHLFLIDRETIRESVVGMKRVALYARVSTDRGNQTTENQLRLLQDAAPRLGWTIVAVHVDEGISGAKGARSGRATTRC